MSPAVAPRGAFAKASCVGRREALMASVESQAGVTLDVADIRMRLKGQLADYGVPKHVKIRSNLLREDSGRILKRRLRDACRERAGRKI